MKFPPLIPLETQRLHLRKPEQRDAEPFFYRLGSSEAVTRHMLWVPHKDISESETSIRKALARCEAGTALRWVITRKEDGTIIGIIDLLGLTEHGTCSFAYMLAEDSWGRGYGTEALKAVLDFAFQNAGVTAVTADHFAENPASGAVMHKVGMTQIGILPRKYEKNGVLHDAISYHITKAEWETARR